MKLREEYEARGLNLQGRELLTDSEDEFSYIYIAPDGQPIIVGYNRNVEIFWRYKDLDEPKEA